MEAKVCLTYFLAFTNARVHFANSSGQSALRRPLRLRISLSFARGCSENSGADGVVGLLELASLRRVRFVFCQGLEKKHGCLSESSVAIKNYSWKKIFKIFSIFFAGFFLALFFAPQGKFRFYPL